ncbi:MAG: cytochrome B [Robiginitomaculum sp.]|nr:MAG: cytochrome B [Robiginitomaculum sp.]
MIGTQNYTKTARWLHWAIAALIVFMLAGGFLMQFVPEDNFSLTVTVYNWHKTFGLLVLVLSVARLVWRLTHKPPPLDASIKAWEAWLSKLVHVVFYVFMIGMPLIGWAIISTSRFPSKLFNAVPLAKLPILRDFTGDVRENINGLFGDIHKVFAFIAIALIVLHIAAAVKHHREDGVFIRRMLANKKKAD